MKAPDISTSKIWVTGIKVSSLSCFFKPLYFSSIFSRRPYLVGIDPSIQTTEKSTQLSISLGHDIIDVIKFYYICASIKHIRMSYVDLILLHVLI